jgi:hypothetical protein
MRRRKVSDADGEFCTPQSFVFEQALREGSENGVGPKHGNILPAQSCAATIHDGQGGERITDPFDPAAPRVGLFGVHDGKRFADALSGSEIFIA